MINYCIKCSDEGIATEGTEPFTITYPENVKDSDFNLLFQFPLSGTWYLCKECNKKVFENLGSSVSIKIVCKK